MEAYEKINWRENLLIEDNEFLPEEELRKTYLSRFVSGTYSPDDYDFDEVVKPQSEVRVPGKRYYHNTKLVSKLDKLEHVKLINALKIITSGRKKIDFNDRQDLELYNNVKPVIAEESARLGCEAQNNWHKTYAKQPLKMNQSLFNYATYERKSKLKCLEKQLGLYKSVDLLSYSYTDSETPIEMIHTANILDLGKVGKFGPPTMVDAFLFKPVTLPELKVNELSSKLPVSQDRNISRILETQDANIVISMSGLKKLMDFTSVDQKWDMPIVIKDVKSINGKGECISKKVIYFDKPMPKHNINMMDLNERCHKLLVKTNFCNEEAFSYTGEDILMPDNSTAVTSLKVNLEDDPQSSPKENLCDFPKKTANILHNASYRMWTLGQKVEGSTLMKQVSHRSFKVLVRNKIDACEPLVESNSLQACTVIPKLEYQLEFGASTYSKSELAKQWATLYFKPYSTLHRVRIQYSSSEVVKIESCNLQKVVNEAVQHYNYKPQLGLGVLFKICSELWKYPAGKYLLHHEAKHGAFVALLQETKVETDDVYDLRKLFAQDAPTNAGQKAWCPIDYSVLLPIYEHHGHMPGLFRPRAPKPPPAQKKGPFNNHGGPKQQFKKFAKNNGGGSVAKKPYKKKKGSKKKKPMAPKKSPKKGS